MAKYSITLEWDEKRQEAQYKTNMIFPTAGIEKHLSYSSSLQDAVNDCIAGDNGNPEIEFRGFKSNTKHLDLSL